jgi:hypothetical protein
MHTQGCQGFGPESSCNLILLKIAERHDVQKQTTMLPDKHPEHAAKQQEMGYRTENQTFHSYNRHTIHNIRNLKRCTDCSCTGCPVMIDCTVAQPAPAHCDASQVSCRTTDRHQNGTSDMTQVSIPCTIHSTIVVPKPTFETEKKNLQKPRICMCIRKIHNYHTAACPCI